MGRGVFKRTLAKRRRRVKQDQEEGQWGWEDDDNAGYDDGPFGQDDGDDSEDEYGYGKDGDRDSGVGEPSGDAATDTLYSTTPIVASSSSLDPTSCKGGQFRVNIHPNVALITDAAPCLKNGPAGLNGGDLYVVATMGKTTKQSSVKKNTRTARWDDTIDMGCQSASTPLRLSVVNDMNGVTCGAWEMGGWASGGGGSSDVAKTGAFVSTDKRSSLNVDVKGAYNPSDTPDTQAEAMTKKVVGAVVGVLAAIILCCCCCFYRRFRVRMRKQAGDPRTDRLNRPVSPPPPANPALLRLSPAAATAAGGGVSSGGRDTGVTWLFGNGRPVAPPSTAPAASAGVHIRSSGGRSGSDVPSGSNRGQEPTGSRGRRPSAHDMRGRPSSSSPYVEPSAPPAPGTPVAIAVATPSISEGGFFTTAVAVQPVGPYAPTHTDGDEKGKYRR